MATLTLKVDNDTVFNNLKNVLKLIKGVTILPTASTETNSSASRVKDISGIGGAWASEDYPTPDDIYSMRKASHRIPEL